MGEKKSFEHNVIEICNLTKESINTKTDDYAILIDCRGREIKSIKFYKHQYLLDIIKGNSEKISQKLWQRTMGMAGNMLQKAGIMKPQEVYEVSP